MTTVAFLHRSCSVSPCATSKIVKVRLIHGAQRLSTKKLMTWTMLLPAGLLTGICYAGYRYYWHRNRVASSWQVNLYQFLPLRTTSRLWGHISDTALPSFLLYPMLRLYVWTFNCKMHEALKDDLRQYNTINEFFTRELKQGVRLIDQNSLITSPADGKVLHFGRVVNGSIEQVKGVSFSVDTFLGPHLSTLDVNENISTTQTTMPSSRKASNTISAKEKTDSILDKNTKHIHNTPLGRGNDLYFCTIYLAPGDYHRFHSPTLWTVTKRRHFPGGLLSVSPYIMRKVAGLFNYNERVLYYGQWQHGFFVFAAIGATNVGSIRVYFDPELDTNQRRLAEQKDFYDKLMKENESVRLDKGQMMGEFNLGSSLVCIFEAPAGFKFNIQNGQIIKVGESIGSIEN